MKITVLFSARQEVGEFHVGPTSRMFQVVMMGDLDVATVYCQKLLETVSMWGGDGACSISDV